MYSKDVDLSEIMGATWDPATDTLEMLRDELTVMEGSGFAAATDTLEKLRDEQTVMEGAGFATGTDSLLKIRQKTTSINDKTSYLTFTSGRVNCQPTNKGVLNDLSQVDVNQSVDIALNTAIPGSPTANSINAVVKDLDGRKTFEVTNYTLSDNLLHSNDDLAPVTNAVYEKAKEIMCPITETIRVEFKLQTMGTIGQIAKGKIYKNGIAHGAEKATTTTTWETFSEDLAFTIGDTIELWIHGWGGPIDCEAKELRIYGDVYQNFVNTMV